MWVKYFFFISFEVGIHITCQHVGCPRQELLQQERAAVVSCPVCLSPLARSVYNYPEKCTRECLHTPECFFHVLRNVVILRSL